MNLFIADNINHHINTIKTAVVGDSKTQGINQKFKQWEMRNFREPGVIFGKSSSSLAINFLQMELEVNFS